MKSLNLTLVEANWFWNGNGELSAELPALAADIKSGRGLPIKTNDGSEFSVTFYSENGSLGAYCDARRKLERMEDELFQRTR